MDEAGVALLVFRSMNGSLGGFRQPFGRVAARRGAAVPDIEQRGEEQVGAAETKYVHDSICSPSSTTTNGTGKKTSVKRIHVVRR